MAATNTNSILELIETEIPRIRGNMDDQEWEQNLFEQVDDMVSRLRSDEPLDIRDGLKQGIAVFSIYELLITARKERARVDAVDSQRQLIAA